LRPPPLQRSKTITDRYCEFLPSGRLPEIARVELDGRSVFRQRAAGEDVRRLVAVVPSQSWLLFDEHLLIRSGVTIGPLVKSYGQSLGPELVRAHELESKEAKYPGILMNA
jgi:hypothetical protein